MNDIRNSRKIIKKETASGGVVSFWLCTDDCHKELLESIMGIGYHTDVLIFCCDAARGMLYF